MDAQELWDPERVLAICVKNLNSIVNKINNAKPFMIGMKPNDSIKLDFVELDKSESYSKEKALPEDGFYRYLHNPGEQRGDKKDTS